MPLCPLLRPLLRHVLPKNHQLLLLPVEQGAFTPPRRAPACQVESPSRGQPASWGADVVARVAVPYQGAQASCSAPARGDAAGDVSVVLFGPSFVCGCCVRVSVDVGV